MSDLRKIWLPDKTILTRKMAVKCTENGVLTVPEGITTLSSDFAYFQVRKDLPNVERLVIPASVERIESMRGDSSFGPFGFHGNPFTEVVVASDNPKFASQRGVLFTKDGKKLICYPCGKPETTYAIPQGVEVIKASAFLNAENLLVVLTPPTLARIEDGAFEGTDCIVI